MINERTRHISRPIWAVPRYFCTAQCYFQARENDDERCGGIRNCSRRDIGSVAIIQLWTVRAIRSTSAAAIAEAAAIVEEAVMAAATGVAAAIDAAGREKQWLFGPPQARFF